MRAMCGHVHPQDPQGRRACEIEAGHRGAHESADNFSWANELHEEPTAPLPLPPVPPARIRDVGLDESATGVRADRQPAAFGGVCPECGGELLQWQDEGGTVCVRPGSFPVEPGCGFMCQVVVQSARRAVLR